MTVTAPTLSETYANLDKALADIKTKKKIMDDMQKEVDKLIENLRVMATDYNKSIEVARTLKQQLHDTIESVIPSPSERIKV